MNQFKLLLDKDVNIRTKNRELEEHLTKIGLDPHQFQVGERKVTRLMSLLLLLLYTYFFLY